jgi:hypothetical protein
VVHASAMSRNGQAMMFPSQSGAGKSTTALYLSEAGYDYLGDDFIILHDGHVHSYPTPLNLFPYHMNPLIQKRPNRTPGVPEGVTRDSGVWHTQLPAGRPAAGPGRHRRCGFSLGGVRLRLWLLRAHHPGNGRQRAENTGLRLFRLIDHFRQAQDLVARPRPEGPETL